MSGYTINVAGNDNDTNLILDSASATIQDGIPGPSGETNNNNIITNINSLIFSDDILKVARVLTTTTSKLSDSWFKEINTNVPSKFQGVFRKDDTTYTIGSNGMSSYNSTKLETTSWFCIGSDSSNNQVLMVDFNYDNPVGWNGGAEMRSGPWNAGLAEGEDGRDLATSIARVLCLHYDSSCSLFRYTKAYVDLNLTGIATFREIRIQWAIAVPPFVGENPACINWENHFAILFNDNLGLSYTASGDIWNYDSTPPLSPSVLTDFTTPGLIEDYHGIKLPTFIAFDLNNSFNPNYDPPYLRIN